MDEMWKPVHRMRPKTSFYPYFVSSHRQNWIRQDIKQHRNEVPTECDDGYYSRLLDKDKPLWYRLLWALVIVASCLLCIYQIADRFCLLLAEPITSNMEIIKNATIKYPSFTLCLSSDYVPKINRLKVMLNKTFQGKNISCDLSHYELVDIGLIANFTELWSYLDVRQLGIERTFFSVGNMQKQNVKVKEKTSKTIFGDCITYTIPEARVFIGSESAFIIYFLTLDDLCPHLPAAATYAFVAFFKLSIPPGSHRRGALGIDFKSRVKAYIFYGGEHFYVHDDSINPKYKMNFFGTNIRKNQAYTVEMKAKQFYNLDISRDPCVASEAYEDCYNKCLEKLFNLELPCKLPITDLSRVPDCWNSTVLLESIKQMISIITETDPKQDCNCKRKCTETTYEFKLLFSRNTFPTTGVFPKFTINVFEVITEKGSYSFIGFICDAGGNLGLFLGLCLLSLVDIIETFTMYLNSRVPQ